MTARYRIIAGLLAAIIALVAVYRLIYRPLYQQPRARLVADIAEASSRTAELRRMLDDRAALDNTLNEYIDRTLGASLEKVDHELRSRLNRIGEDVGLRGLVVSTGRVRQLQSPARGRYRTRGVEGQLRAEIDFVELEGSVSGEGTYEQVLRLVSRITNEPWLKRISNVRLTPQGNPATSPHGYGEQFAVAVRLTTLFVPGRAPQSGTEVAIAADGRSLDEYAQLLAWNPFHMPKPPEAPRPGGGAPVVDAGPTPDPPFPYHEWRITGVADGPTGLEVWLVNRNSGASRRLAIGDSIHDVVLVAAGGEEAEFEEDDNRFRVAVGQTLSDRSPLSQ